MTPRALVVGDVMTDIVVRLAEPFAWASDTVAEIVERPGGSAATFAVWLAREGVDVDFVARVGASEVERLTAELQAEGVTAWLKADPDLPTGRLIALVEPSGERSFLTDRGANDALALDDIPAETLVHADWLHLSGYTFQHPVARAAVRDLLRRASEIPVSVDPGSAAPLRAMGPENFLAWTAGAAVLFPNADEAAALTGTDDPALQRERLKSKYPLVVIKRGAAGAEALSGAVRWSAPAPATQAIDTTGAGDAFAAGFVAARLAGESPEACLRRAVAAGAAATTIVGGRPG
jgi:sugar/nucleoside kinase (ribokinase family)